MRLLKTLFIAIVFGFFINQEVLAEEHRHRQHGVHEHGAGHLNVVIEGKMLIVELISPAVNIVGFEHEPGNKEQKDGVHKAIETLKDSGQVFSLPPDSHCKLSRVEVETDIIDDHDDDEHDSGHHDEAHHEHKEKRHSEFHASYEFSCGYPEKLKYIDVNIFSLFKETEELETQVIAPGGQFSQELTPASARIRL